MSADGSGFPGLGAERRPLGEILLAEGVISESDLHASLLAQKESRARVGDILAARSGADRTAIAAAAARQAGYAFVDLRSSKPGAGEVSADQLDMFIRERIFPFSAPGGKISWAAASVGGGTQSPRPPGGVAEGAVHAAEPKALSGALIGAFGPHIAARSATRRPEAESMRAGFARWQVAGAAMLAGAAAMTAALWPHAAFDGFLVFSSMVLVMNGCLWGGALCFGRAKQGGAPEPPQRLPKVSILVPLYHEPEMAHVLVRSLAALDYPPELLDVKLILEADDARTRAALDAAALPPNFDVLTAPDGAPRTKPRALNFALDFTEGELIGVYDAEDQPEPGQIRAIVSQFEKAAPETACIQARLGYYNAGENWLTRCFEIEYASWFDALLPALHRLNLPIPLGGTSLFVRRAALEAAGGWDSHNVTEDADLGMMLARAGMRTELSPSITLEEASCSPGAWIRQRSRWLKGYLSTWATHMRNPRALWRDLGARRFAGFNAVLLSAVLAYLTLPWLWLTSAVMLISGETPGQVFGVYVVISTIVTPLMAGVAAMGLQRRGKLRLFLWVLTLPLYWLLGSAAACLALWELVRSPFSWRKTRHGVSQTARTMRGEMGEDG